MTSMKLRRTFSLRRRARSARAPLVALLALGAVALFPALSARAQSSSDSELSEAFKHYSAGAFDKADGYAQAMLSNTALRASTRCDACMLRGAIAVRRGEPRSSAANWFAMVIRTCPGYKPPTEYFPDGLEVMQAWNEFMATQSVDVTVTCNPPCHLFLDDQFKGIQTSLKLEDLRPASYTIEALWRPSATTPGSCWPAERRTVTVKAGEQRREEPFTRPQHTATLDSPQTITSPASPKGDVGPGGEFLPPVVRVLLSVLLFSGFMYFTLSGSGLI